MYALVTSRLDYANYLMIGVQDIWAGCWLQKNRCLAASTSPPTGRCNGLGMKHHETVRFIWRHHIINSEQWYYVKYDTVKWIRQQINRIPSCLNTLCDEYQTKYPMENTKKYFIWRKNQFKPRTIRSNRFEIKIEKPIGPTTACWSMSTTLS